MRRGCTLYSLQRVTHSANMDNKSNIDKLDGGVYLMLEKMKRLSLGFQKDKCTTLRETFQATLFLLSFKTSNNFTNFTLKSKR